MGDYAVHMSSTDNSVPLTNWTTSLLSSSSSSNISTATTTMMENVVTAVASGEVTADNAESLRVVRYVVQKVCVPVVVAVGVLGNSLNMVVLTRRSMKNSTSCYLTALAAFDLVYLLCSLTLSFKHYHLVHRNMVYVHWFCYGRVLSDMAANVSVLLTITFTVERYIGVCHPIKGRVLCTPQRARIVIALVVAVAVICTLPELFETEVVWQTDDRTWNNITNTTTTNTTTNTSHPDLTPHTSFLRYPTTRYTPFASTYGYQIGYYWFLAVGFTFVPLLVLCVFNGILIASLFRAARLRVQLTSRGSGRGSHPRGSCRGSSRGSSRGPSRGLHLSSSRVLHLSSSSSRGHSKGHSRRPQSSSSFSSFSSSFSSCCHSSSPSPVPERGCREQQWITQMLVTVVLVFILCQLPGAILMLIRASRHLAQVEMSAYSRNQFYMAANVTNLLLQINAAINFLLYSVTSSKFRQVCVRVLCLRSGVRPLPPFLRSSLCQQELRLTSLESRSSRKPPASSRDRWKSVSSRRRALQHIPCYSLLDCSSNSARQQCGGVNGTAHAPSQNFRGKDGV